jgi:hypothetical protein
MSIWLSVIFVGIFGTGSTRVERQVESLLHHDAGIESSKIASGDLHQLTRHADGSAGVVDKLHSDGVIAGELIDATSGVTLRIVMYRADGSLKSLMEIPLAKRLLTKDDLSVLRTNLEDDIADLVRAAARKPAVAPDPAPLPPSPVVSARADPPPAPRLAPPAPHPAPVTRVQTAAPTPAAPPRVETPPPPPVVAEVAPDKDATQQKDSDSVSLAELEATTAATPADAAADSDPKVAASPSLGLGAAAGFGITQRSFSPGPATLPAYSSSPVGTVQFDAHVSPVARFAIGVHMETTVDMTSSLASGSAPTTMTRWEAVASYRWSIGSASLEPTLGFGSRSFAIDSVDPTRSPDNDYNYIIAGARLSLPISERMTLLGTFAIEPVIGGKEATEMSFGDASRWAFDLGAAVEARPWSHVYVRAGAGYQRFSWSWDMAGARGAGGAADSYPSGVVALGAEY